MLHITIIKPRSKNEKTVDDLQGIPLEKRRGQILFKEKNKEERGVEHYVNRETCSFNTKNLL